MVVKKKKGGAKKKKSSSAGSALTEADTFVYEIPLVRVPPPNTMLSDFYILSPLTSLSGNGRLCHLTPGFCPSTFSPPASHKVSSRTKVFACPCIPLA